MITLLIGLLLIALFLYALYVVLGLFKGMPENVRYAIVVVIGVCCLIALLNKAGFIGGGLAW